MFFEQKLARNTLFLSKAKDVIVLDSDQVSCLVPTVLHLSAAKSEHFDFNILKKLQMFVRVIENLYNETFRQSQTYFALNARYSSFPELLILALTLSKHGEIDVFHVFFVNSIF